MISRLMFKPHITCLSTDILIQNGKTLTTDTLVNKSLTNGSEVYCIDTSECYLYDEENKTLIKTKVNSDIFIDGEITPESINIINNKVDNFIDNVNERIEQSDINKIVELSDTIGDEDMGVTATTLKGGIAEHSTYLNQIKYYVTPQMFGAKGDGIADDTIPLQNAIDYCLENNTTLISNGKYRYLITQPLLTQTTNIDFNGAILTTTNNINIIEIDSDDFYGTIKNITFDCTNANSGIMIKQGKKKTFINLVFNNIKTYGFYYDRGYEVLLEDSHFNGQPSKLVTGLYCNSSDAKFQNNIFIDCFKAIVNKGANFFDYIHAWMKTSDIIEGSIMFELLGNSAHITNCYSDTYYITFNCNGGSVNSTLLKVFFNQDIYLSLLSVPYLFYFVNISDQNSTRNSLINSTISGVRSNQKILFSNIDTPKVKVNNNNLIWVSRYIGGIEIPITSEGTNITNIVTNKMTIKNGVVNINLVFEIDTAISSIFSFNNIDTQYRPTSAINFICGVGSTQFNINNVGYLFIKDKVTGEVPDDDTVKWVKINITYPISNENY